VHEIRHILGEAGLVEPGLGETYLVLHAFVNGHLILAEATDRAQRVMPSQDPAYSQANVKNSFELGLEYLIAGIEARVLTRKPTKRSRASRS
jgi:hypothetical protein